MRWLARHGLLACLSGQTRRGSAWHAKIVPGRKGRKHSSCLHTPRPLGWGPRTVVFLTTRRTYAHGPRRNCFAAMATHVPKHVFDSGPSTIHGVTPPTGVKVLGSPTTPGSVTVVCRVQAVLRWSLALGAPGRRSSLRVGTPSSLWR